MGQLARLWSKSLATGNAEIDHQHQRLFDALEALMTALSADAAAEELTKLVEFLREYTLDHFGFEEDLMAEHAYPKLSEHVEQHDMFTKMVVDVGRSLGEQGPTDALAQKLNHEIAEWLRNHIRDDDHSFCDYVSG